MVPAAPGRLAQLFGATAALAALVAACSPGPVTSNGAEPAPVGAPADHASAEASAPPQDSPGAAGVSLAPLEVQASWCSRAGCRTTFTFSEPMVPADQLATAAAPVVFAPPQAGRFDWKTPRQLVFTPAEGAFNWGHRISALVPTARSLAGHRLEQPFTQHLWVPNFSVGDKMATWPVIKGQPRAIGLLRHSERRVGRAPMLLLYDQPVDARRVGKHLRVETAGGRRLKARVYRPKDAAPLWTGELDPRHLVAIQMAKAPKDGSLLTVVYPTWKDGKEPALGKTAVTAATRLQISKLAVVGAGAGEAVSAHPSVALTLSTPVSREALREHLVITPALTKAPEISTWSSYDGAGATIYPNLAPGREYRVTIRAGLGDVLGNKLAKTQHLTFRTRDLDPRLALGHTDLVLEQGRAAIPVRALNVGRVNLQIHGIKGGAAGFIAAAAKVGAKRCADLGVKLRFLGAHSVDPGAAMNRTHEAAVPVGAAAKAGLVCVDVEAEGRGSQARGALQAARLVQVTSLGVMAKVSAGRLLTWTTRLNDATPAPKARVTVLSATGERLARGRADGDGVLVLEAPDVAHRAGLKQPVFVVAEVAGEVAVARLTPDRLARPWQFGLQATVADSTPLPAAIFTDRGVYRPGEKVHARVLVRDPDGFGVPRRAAIHMAIRDARGKVVAERDARLDEVGGAGLELALADGASVGRYTLTVKRDDAVAAKTFLVEEYRVPTFEVKVRSDDETWRPGARAHATIEARYLHGGRLAGRAVRYRVTRQPLALQAPGMSEFVFASPAVRAEPQVVAEDEARLDGQGKLALDFAVAAGAATGPARYVIEATATDLDRQAYAGRMSRAVHPTDTYVGVRPPRHAVLPAGTRLEVPIVAVDAAGRPKTGVKVRAVLERIDHQTVAKATAGGHVQRLNHAVAVPGKACRVTTRKAGATCTFELPKAGRYQVRAWRSGGGRDRVVAGFELTASGDQLAAWPRFDHERIEVTTDKARYAPGDVARLVVQSPFAEARGLLTLERDGVIEHRVFTISGDTPVLEVPLTDAHAPNVYASVVLVRGRVHDCRDALGNETGAPAMRLGYAKLAVTPAAARLAVDVTPARGRVEPGETVELTLKVRDAGGRPQAGRATVMVVDEAVLGLTRYGTPNPVAGIYRDRPLGVRTADSRLELIQAWRDRHAAIFTAGDGDEDYAGPSTRRGRRGGSEVEGREPLDVRTLLEATALWAPDVPIDEAGEGRVQVTLPDNTTTWRIMAVVATPAGPTGSADAPLVAAKPLMVQPIAPRFLYPGDRLNVGATVFNGTTEDAEVTVTAAFEGMKLQEGPAVVRRLVKAGGSVAVEVPVEVTGRGEAKLRVSAQFGEFSDALEIAVPILNPGSKRRVVETRQIAAEGDVMVAFPADRIPGTSNLEVVLSTTSLSQLKDSVDYLMGYPHGCIEQTTSRAYPLLVLKDLLPDMGVTVDADKLKEYAEAGVKRLLSFQTTAGGLSYWPGKDEPHAFGTAFGLTALLEARKQGYAIPEDALARMADYLETALRKGEIQQEMPHGGMADGDTKALFAMTLGRLGRPQPAMIEALWRGRDKLTPFGLGFLAVAAEESTSHKALREPMLAAIRKAAKENDQEAWYAGERGRGYSMASPLRTHAGALLAWAGARPDADGSRKLLSGLLNRARNGSWGNTQENVFGIMAVATLAREAKKTGGPKAELAIAGRPVPLDAMEPVSNRVRRFEASAAELGFDAEARREVRVKLKNRAAGPMFLTVRAEYEVVLNERLRAPVSHGLKVRRRVETLDGDALAGRALPLGSVVRVMVDVAADEAQNYVAIVDPLPAGLEPLNTRLDTTEQVVVGRTTPEQTRGLAHLSYSEIRDERVAFYVDAMPAGKYRFSYLARATTAGRFVRPAATAEAMYAPDVFGHGSAGTVVVR